MIGQACRRTIKMRRVGTKCAFLSNRSATQQLCGGARFGPDAVSRNFTSPTSIQCNMNLDSRKLTDIQSWNKLWDTNNIPFHEDHVNKKLVRHLDTLTKAVGRENGEIRFFLPLAGKTLDLVYLYKNGLSVVGCEASEKACHELFTENNIEYETSRGPDFTYYTSKDGRLKMICGDFFKLTLENCGGKIDCVWDRGSLVAIPLDMRERYVKVIRSLLDEKFFYLIASIERNVEPDGPMPFSFTHEHACRLFGNFCNVHIMEQVFTKKPDQDGKNWIKSNTFILTAQFGNRLDYWKQRWTDNNIGWHRDHVNKHLLRHLSILTDGREKLKILFPLSGKSLDLVHMYNEGHTVVGIEGVPMAVEEMFKLGNIEHETNYCDDIEGFIYKTSDGRLTVYACDIFKMKPDLLSTKLDSVFDRGAFEAVYEHDREPYVKLMLECLQPDFRYILNAFEYDDSVFKGPPRCISREKAVHYFNGHGIEGCSGKTTHVEVLHEEVDVDVPERLKKEVSGPVTKREYLIKMK